MKTFVSIYFHSIILTISIIVIGGALFQYTAPPVLASGGCEFIDPSDPLGVDCVGAGNPSLNDEDPRIIVGRIIQIALGLIGIITTVLIIWAGFRWMTSAGNDEQVTSAKKTLTAAVIGLIIIMMAYSLSSFFIDELYRATSGRVVR